MHEPVHGMCYSLTVRPESGKLVLTCAFLSSVLHSSGRVCSALMRKRERKRVLQISINEYGHYILMGTLSLDNGSVKNGMI